MTILTTFIHLTIGDIIVFKTSGIDDKGQHITIVHRLAKIGIDNNGNRVIQTKGDANPRSIPYLDYPIR